MVTKMGDVLTVKTGDLFINTSRFLLAKSLNTVFVVSVSPGGSPERPVVYQTNDSVTCYSGLHTASYGLLSASMRGTFTLVSRTD